MTMAEIKVCRNERAKRKASKDEIEGASRLF